MITLGRRGFLRLLLASPLAATVDVEKLLWVPKPLITVPANYGIWVGAINKASFTFWRNQHLYGGLVGGGKTLAIHELLERKLKALRESVEREVNRDLFSDGAGLPFSADVQVEEFDDDPDY